MINIESNITWLRRLAFLAIFIFFSSALCAQRSETVSKAYHIRIEDKQLLLDKLRVENLKNEQDWQRELDARKRNLPSEQAVSDNIMVSVKPTVDIKLTEEGGEEMNLNVNFTYETARMSTIVYYAGHGVPDPETYYSFLVPTDANPEKKSQLYSLSTLYQTLGSLPAKSVIIFIDACFSGTKRNGEMLVQDTKGVKISVKEDVLEGNMVVFSAASGNQTAYPLREQKHGMFTYYLLKTLKESRGNISCGDLFRKVKTGVSREASAVSKQQIPSANVSVSLLGSWESLNVKE